MKNYSIHSIYAATEGEGVRVGTPQIFIRFMGCNVGCINCDSKDTWEFLPPNMNIGSILTKVEEESGSFENRIHNISITGGDPLHPKNLGPVIEISKALKNKNFFINIEAAGTRIDDTLFDIVDFISFDIKTPSTGVRFNEKLFLRFLKQYGHKSQVKAVVQNRHDFDFIYDIYKRNRPALPYQLVITPCFNPGEETPKVLTQSLIELNQSLGGPFRVIMQQHKMIYSSNFGNF